VVEENLLMGWWLGVYSKYLLCSFTTKIHLSWECFVILNACLKTLFFIFICTFLGLYILEHFVVC